MKRNFMTGVWIVFMLLLLRTAWRERETYPLRWSGYGGSHAPTIFLGAVLVIALYFWWSNRRDSK
ncbi:MAG TPA: hypothetical protein VNH19_19975 [Candidatus Limnocylindrales bacterium]|nr:hypothetical protein [Candidatus Limnocylindrales bacterium]